jgi:homoserine O-acetyltransferase
MIRDVYVGPEHALDPEKYFIVVVNQIACVVPSYNHAGPFWHFGTRREPVRRALEDVEQVHLGEEDTAHADLPMFVHDHP